MSLLIRKDKLITVELLYKPFGGTIRVETPETLKELTKEIDAEIEAAETDEEREEIRKERQNELEGFTKLTMKMRPLDWKLYNDLQKKSLVERGPGMEDVVNWVTYKENKFQSILVEWDAKEDGKPIPISPQTIGALHPVIPELALREYDAKSVLGEETEPEPEKNPPAPEEPKETKETKDEKKEEPEKK